AECVMPACELRPTAPRMFEHPSRVAVVSWRGTDLGRLFEFHPRFIETGRAVVLDVDLREVERLSKQEKRYQPIRRYPESGVDLSVVTEKRTLIGDLHKSIASFAGPHLVAIDFLRQYEGPPLPEGSKSVSFRITVAAKDHTMSSEEVNAIR